MQKTVSILLALISVPSVVSAQAASIATIVTQESPVWVLHDEIKTELSHNNVLTAGDHIITGDSGRVEMEIGSDATLKLDIDSEIVLQSQMVAQKNTKDNHSDLQILYGSACLKNKIPVHSTGDFKINIGNTIFVALSPSGHICVNRENWLWSIKLLSGSARVAYSSDSNLIGLSQAGTELQIDDFGSYQLLFTSINKLLKPEKTSPVKTTATDKKEKHAEEVITEPNNEAPVKTAKITPLPELLPRIETSSPMRETTDAPVNTTTVTKTPHEVDKISPEKVAPVAIPAKMEKELEQVEQLNAYQPVDINEELNRAEKKYYAGYPYQAIAIIKPVALSGDAKAQFLLGNIIYSLANSEKFVINEDPVKWYKMAAAQDHPEAYNALGTIYQNIWIKSDDKADLELAISYYGQAAKLSHKTAKTSLSKLKSMAKSPKKIKSLNYTNITFKRLN